MILPSVDQWKTALVTLPEGGSGIGSLSLAGTVAKARPIAANQYRVFGQWAFVYLVAGSGIYSDHRGFQSPVVAGDWILVFPELAHQYGPRPGELWNEIYVCFRGPIFECWRNSGLLDPRRPIGYWMSPKDCVPKFETFFQRIAQRDCSALEAVCRWQEVLAGVFQQSSPSDVLCESWLQYAKDLLDSTDLKPREVAAKCGVGYESFRKQFARATGIPPARFALERRIERARQLLKFSRITNQKVASLLGFHDEFHFSKSFKKLTGMSPRQYRVRPENGTSL